MRTEQILPQWESFASPALVFIRTPFFNRASVLTGTFVLIRTFKLASLSRDRFFGLIRFVLAEPDSGGDPSVVRLLRGLMVKVSRHRAFEDNSASLP